MKWFPLLLLLVPQSTPVDFKRDIQPIFAASCLKCHGPEGKPKGQLRLDLRAVAMRKAITPGKSADSLLYRVLVHADEDARMPQKAAPLPAAQIDLIRRWIDEGAKWPDDAAGVEVAHWSLRPLPAATPGSIDAFIQAKLKEKGLSSSPEADRRTLLRRVTYDLTGLPPTPEEMESNETYEQAVDRLLASPRYGERWARHWLDAIHYADTHGHDQDRPRVNAWPYRDYVVRALNEDKAWARFVEEQLAGDVLHPGDPQGIVATGFIAAGPWDESSQMHIMADTVDKKIAQNLDRDDMLTATMSAFMSATVQCARCHNHKFDPIPQAEYYALQACFAGVDRANRPFDDDPAVNARRQALLRKKTDVALKRFELTPEVEAEVAAWEKARKDTSESWQVVDAETLSSKEGSTLVKQPDGSILSTGPRPATDHYIITARAPLQRITAVRLEVLTVDDHPYKGPGRQDNGNFHLSEFKLRLGKKAVPLLKPTADFNQAGWTIAHAVDGKTETAWGIYPEVGKVHEAVFPLQVGVDLDPEDRITFILEQDHGRHHLIHRPRLSVRSSPVKSEIPEAIAKIAASVTRSREQQVELAAFVLDQRIKSELDALPKPRMVYAAASDFTPEAKFTPARIPRPIFLLKRGDVTKPGEPAKSGGLSVVGVPFAVSDDANEGQRRAALARWIVDPKNMLTWRSVVNRVWHHHFGRGLADSPNDLGKMGATPSHPELLDWLAAWFLDHGGSLKQLHRLIVTSAVYRQSSAHRADYAKLDSTNVYLWRMNRLRLDAEQVRDSVLQLSGKLDLKMGGPSVKQFHYEDPNPGVTPKVDYAKYDVDHPDNFRRSIYRWIFRTLPDPFMETLDCPDASQLTGSRNVSVTPLQAMAVMNNRFVVRQSEHLAARAGSVEVAYRLVLQRRPTDAERRSVQQYADSHGLANACRVLLNSNEFMFLD